MRKSMSYLIILTLVCAHLLTIPTPAYACSGGSGRLPELKSYVDDSEVIAEAKVLFVDESSKSALVEVSEYFKGDVSLQYLVMEQNRYAEYFFNSGSCDHRSVRLRVGQRGFYFSKRTPHGSYLSQIFAIQESQPPYVAWFIPITESGFARMITELVKQPSHVPQKEYPLPNTAPIGITTESGVHYILPLDWSDPVKIGQGGTLWGTDPRGSAPSRIGRGCSVYDDEGCSAPSYKSLLSFKITENGIEDVTPYQPKLDPIPGQAFLFSPADMDVAVWNTDRLQIYHIGHFRDVEMLLSKSSIGGVPGVAAWSADGRFLAYTDILGLWLWQIKNPKPEPRLLIPAADYVESPEGLPIALRFSPRGHFLTVQENKLIFTLDILTGERFPDGVVSPDDLHLLTFRSLSDSNFRAEVCAFGNPCGEGVPSLTHQIIQPTWISPTKYSYLLCDTEMPETDNRCRLHSGTLDGKYQDEPATAFAVEWHSKDIAFLKDSRTLIIRRAIAPEQQIDLLALVGEKVVAVGWSWSVMDGPVRNKDWVKYSGLVWSPDGSMLAYIDDAGRIQLLDSNNLHILQTIYTLHDQSYLDWRPDGKQIATAGFYDEYLHVWDVQSGEQVAVQKISGPSLGDIVWNSAGTLLYIVEWDGASLYYFEPISGKLKELSGFSVDSEIVRHPTQPILLLNRAHGATYTLVDSRTPGLQSIRRVDLKELFNTTPFGPYIYNFVWSRDNKLAAVDSEGQIFVWRSYASYDESLLQYRLLPLNYESNLLSTRGTGIADLAFAEDSRWLYALRTDGVLLVFDTEGERVLTTAHPSIAIQITMASSWSAAFSPDGKRLALALDTSIVQIIDLPGYLTRPH